MFADRSEAGELLAEKLTEFREKGAYVLGITRGGVVVAYEVAKNLKLPLKIIVVKKLGAPDNPELALGALTYEGVIVVDWELARRVGADKSFIERQIKEKEKELKDLLQDLGAKERLSVKNKSVIVVDDGIATGATVETVIKYLRKKRAKCVIVAIPVVASDTLEKIKNEADSVIVLATPDFFGAVGQFYEDFPQVSNEEVKKIIKTLKH